MKAKRILGLRTEQMPPPEVKEKVSRTVLLLDFFAQVVDLYLPRAMDTFVALSGVDEMREVLSEDDDDTPKRGEKE